MLVVVEYLRSTGCELMLECCRGQSRARVRGCYLAGFQTWSLTLPASLRGTIMRQAPGEEFWR